MRQINLLVIHCSATRENQPFTIRALETSHRKRGFNGIGYHYYIRQSGEVINTRPLSRIGAHVKGHNRYFIGLCYEGGLDKDGKPKDTRTPNSVQHSVNWSTNCCYAFPAARSADIVTSVPT